MANSAVYEDQAWRARMIMGEVQAFLQSREAWKKAKGETLADVMYARIHEIRDLRYDTVFTKPGDDDEDRQETQRMESSITMLDKLKEVYSQVVDIINQMPLPTSTVSGDETEQTGAYEDVEE